MELFSERFVVPRESLLASYEGLILSDCDVLAGDVTELSLFQLREQGYSGEYELEVAGERVSCELQLNTLYDPMMKKVKFLR